MCSVLGLPNIGSSTTVHITRVNVNPHSVLVEFGGKLYHGQDAKEQQLKDIEVPRKQHAFSGKPGEVCLLYEDRTWHRGRILSKAEHKYKVFLIDNGKLLWATSEVLTKCPRNLCNLAPKLELCILSCVSPLCLDSAWSVAASKFIRSLCGKNISGCVRDVIMPSRIILLDIPSISKQMYELGFARKMSDENFKSLVMHSLHLPRNPSTQTDLEASNGQREHVRDPGKLHDYFYPELSPGTIEIVTVTQVVHPLKIYCKLQVFSQELRKLSDQLHEYYEDAFSAQIPLPLSDGSPCATKGSDGKWYRSVLQQSEISDVVKVFHVDYGIGDFVKLCNIRPLSIRFFHLPVVTYASSLYEVIDKGFGWRTDQIDYLKTLVLDQVLVGKFEDYDVNEGVYNVTLYGNDNVNVNHTFGHKEQCLLVTEKICGDHTLETLNKVTYNKMHKRNESLHSLRSASSTECSSSFGDDVTDGRPSKTEECFQPSKEGHTLNAAVTLQNDAYVNSQRQIKVGSKLKVHITYVQSVNQFYGHFAENTNAIRKLTKDIQQLCRKLPQEKFSISPNMACLAKFSDGLWHRGRIESTHPKILVQFVDYGDLVIVDKSDIMQLPPKASAIASLPIQAVQLELFNVTLPEPCDLNEWFKNYATDCMFTVTVKHNSSGKLSVEMYEDKTNVNLKVKDMWNKTKRKEANNNGNVKIRTFKQSSEGVKARNDLKTMPQAHVKTSMKDGQGRLEQNFKFATNNTTGQKRARPNVLRHPKLTDLPSRTFDVGCSSEVYVSHCNNPSDFFVQLTSEEEEIFSLLDKLNSSQISDVQIELSLLQSGELVRAEYPADGAWYRAVVLNKKGGTVHVQFIDFGNEATLLPLKIKQLDKQFISTPRFSIHCKLEDGRRDWTQEEIMTFKKAAGENGEKKIQCKFIREDTSAWIVHLELQEEPLFTLASQIKSQPLTFKEPAVTQGQTVEVYASSIAGPTHFWCQFKNTDVLDKISLLAQEIGNCCQTEEIQQDQLRQGGLCLALYSDQLWYRAQVISIHEKCTVLFIDYGNESETDLNCIKPLPTKLLESPPQAFLCQLQTLGPVGGTWSEAAADKFFELLVDEPLKVTIQTVEMSSNIEMCPQFGVLVECKEKLVNDLLKDYLSYPQPQTCSQSKTTTDKVEFVQKHKSSNLNSNTRPSVVFLQARDLPQRVIEPGTVSEVYISHINNLTSFYVQLKEDENTLFALTELLNSEKEEVHAINVQQGSLVKAMFPEDNSWYRAKVKNAPESDKIHVEFIDFGNEAVVSPHKICRLKEPLLSHPRFSIHCCYSLDDQFKIQKETKEQDFLFKKVFGEAGEKTLSCNFINKDDLTWEVKMTPNSDTSDLSSEKWDHFDLSALPVLTEPLKETLQLVFKKPDVSLGQTIDAFASCIVGPDYFWCQFSNSEILDQITLVAQECGNSSETQPILLDNLDLGSTCLACFCDDQMWYRGQVIKKCTNTATVLFIDFGNESEISGGSIKALSCDLLEIPPQAFLCRLDGFNPSGGSWDSEATDNFYELIVDKPLKVTVQCIDYSTDPNSSPYHVKIESSQCLVNEFMTKFWSYSAQRDQNSAEMIESCEKAVAPTSVDQSVSENKTSGSLAGDDLTSELHYPEKPGATLIELLVDDNVSENKVDDQLDGADVVAATKNSDPTRANSEEVCQEPDGFPLLAEQIQLQAEECRDDVEDSNSQNDIPLTPSRRTDWVAHLEKQMLPMVCTEDSCDSVK